MAWIGGSSALYLEEFPLLSTTGRSFITTFKVAANKRDVPYQSLIKTWLAEKTGTG